MPVSKMQTNQRIIEVKEAEERLQEARKLLPDAQNRYERAYAMKVISQRERELFELENNEKEGE